MSRGYLRPPVLFDGVVDLSFKQLRFATALCLVAYPLATILQVLFPGHFLGELVGNLLGMGAILTMFLVLAARPTQIVAGSTLALDEYQLSQRLNAISATYQTLAAALLGAAIYVYFALEFGGPLPTQGETWQAIATGVILYVFVLPTAFLVFGLGASDQDEDEAA